VAAIWSRVSVYGKASSSSRCKGVSGPKANPVRTPGPRTAARARGDLPDGLAGPALRLGPVGAAELVQRRDLAAYIPGQQFEGIGGHEQPITWVAPLAGRVLDHQVLPGGAAGGALHQVDVLADAVLGVDDIVAGLERHRVDGVASAGRQPGHPSGLTPRVQVRSASVRIAGPESRRTKPFSSRPQITVTTSVRGDSASPSATTTPISASANRSPALAAVPAPATTRTVDPPADYRSRASSKATADAPVRGEGDFWRSRKLRPFDNRSSLSQI